MNMEQEQLDQARLNHAAGDLNASVLELCRRRGIMDRHLLDDLQQLVKRHRKHCKRVDGIDFPVLHVILFARLGAVELVRADWERKAIEVWVVNCTVKYPNVTSVELAAAVRQAWPNYVSDVRFQRAVTN